LSSYVASHCLAVAPQSDVREQFYTSVHDITLNLICVAQKVSKKNYKMWKIWSEAKINTQMI
jgi:hypothetical protein